MSSQDERTIGTEVEVEDWTRNMLETLKPYDGIVRDFDCPVENEGRLDREVNRLAKKALKLGYRVPMVYKCGIDHIVEYVVEVPGEDGEPPVWVTRKIRVVRCVVAGPELKMNGWTIVAAVDWLAGLPVVRKFPGYEAEGVLTPTTPLCQHCWRKRDRNTTYLLINGGELLQVGSTCLQDFCGLDPTYAAQVAALYEAQGYAENLTRYEADLGEFLSWCAVAVRMNGRFVSRKAAEAEEQRVYETTGRGVNVTTTAQDARSYQQERYNNPDAPEPTDDDRATVAAVQAHVAGLDPDQSDYARSLRSIFDSGILLPRHAGLAASAFGGYLRERERLAEAALRAANQRPSQHLGAVGERLTLRVKVIGLHITEGAYGTTWILRMVTPEGDRITYFSSRDFADVGDELTIKASVKKHESYRGEAGTVITRATIL